MGEGRDEFIPVYLPEFKRHRLIAFEMGANYNKYPQGAYVFVLDEEEIGHLRNGDEVVIARNKSGLTEVGLWEVDDELLVRRSPSGVVVETTTWEGLYDLDLPPGTTDPREYDKALLKGVVHGAVVACQWTRAIPAVKPRAD